MVERTQQSVAVSRGRRASVSGVVAWLVSTPMLMLSVIAVVISVVDLVHPFGLSALPELPANAGESDKKIYDAVKAAILFLGIVSGALAADRVLYFRQVERDLEKIEQEVSAISALSTSSARIFKNRNEFYSAFLSEVAELPYGSSVFVTHYEKLKMPYSGGEDLAEEAVGEVWPRTIAEGRVYVEQLVHVSSLADLNEVLDRANEREKMPNYSLTIVLGPLPDPFFELVIFGEAVVFLAFSARPASPYATDFGVRIESVEFASRMRDYFRMWASRFGVPIKTRDALQAPILEELRNLLPPGHPLDLPVDLGRTAVRVARSRYIHDMVKRIVAAGEAVEQIDHSIFKDKFREKLEDVAAELEVYGRGHIPLETAGIAELSHLIDTASTRVSAVCPYSALAFWTTVLGVKVREACGRATSRDVIVQRIYVVQDVAAISAQAAEAMKFDNSMGVEVFIATESDIGEDDVKDFVIIDGKLVFEDYSQGVGGTGAVDVSTAGLRRYEGLWSHVVQQSRKYDSKEWQYLDDRPDAH